MPRLVDQTQAHLAEAAAPHLRRNRPPALARLMREHLHHDGFGAGHRSRRRREKIFTAQQTVNVQRGSAAIAHRRGDRAIIGGKVTAGEHRRAGQSG